MNKSNNGKRSTFMPRPLAMLVFEAEDVCDAHSSEGEGAAYPSRLAEALGRHFRVAPTVSSNGELWHQLFEEIPSVVIISQTIRFIDFLGLIRSLRASKYKFDIHYFLCCKRVNASVKSLCERGGIDGAFAVGDEPADVAQQIFEKYTELESSRNERRLNSIMQMLQDDMFFSDRRDIWQLGSNITDTLLLPLGFDGAHNGTKYLELIICLRVFGAERNMGCLYELASICFNASSSSVEKAIRYSIERAWSGSTPYMQYKLFGNSVDPEKGKPTNSEFVETAVRHTLDLLVPGRM